MVKSSLSDRLCQFLGLLFFGVSLVSLARAQGTISTVAGNGVQGFSGDGGPATSAELYWPAALAVDGAGNLYFADYYNNRIRKITPGGIISTVTAAVSYPSGVAVDSAGNLYLGDSNDNRIRKVTPAGVISTVAGSGFPGFSGDGGPAISAELNFPTGVAVDAAGNLYIADNNNNRIRKVTAAGIISTIAGNGTAGYSGDGGPATSAQLSLNQYANPKGVAVDAAGGVYFSDFNNNRVRKVTPSGTITTTAGNGIQGYAGDGGPATSAEICTPEGVWLDNAGNLYIADEDGFARMVSTAGIITTVAGIGGASYSGDGGPATSASLNWPSGVAIDGAGNLYISDTQNNRIRKVSYGRQLAPSVSTAGIVNNASYAPGSNAVAPGTIVAIFGTSLTIGSTASNGYCLPPSCNPTFGSNGILNTTLAGTQVTVNGTPAPIFYASPGQLGVQIPFETTGTSANVAVSANGQTSASSTLAIAGVSPGIFTVAANGQGAGAITHANGSLVTNTSPALPGEIVILYATGLGQVSPAVATGALPSATSSAVAAVTLTIGGIPVTPAFAGLAGCCVGLNQINVQVPASVSAGSAVPVILSIAGQTSNTATIAVQ